MLLQQSAYSNITGTGSQVTPGFPHSQIRLRVASPKVQEHGRTTPVAYELASDTYHGLGVMTDRFRIRVPIFSLSHRKVSLHPQPFPPYPRSHSQTRDSQRCLSPTPIQADDHQWITTNPTIYMLSSDGILGGFCPVR